MNRNGYWLIDASRFDSSRVVLISPSRLMQRLFTGNRVGFDLRSEATVTSIEIQAVSMAMRRCGELSFGPFCSPARTCFKFYRDAFAWDQDLVRKGTKK
jgi:hypothetical protein